MTDQARPTCVSCPHYLPEEGLQKRPQGFCRRHPPTMFVTPGVDHLGRQGMQFHSQNPPVQASGGCGEHPEFIRWYSQNKTRMPEIAAMERATPEGSA